MIGTSLISHHKSGQQGFSHHLPARERLDIDAWLN